MDTINGNLFERFSECDLSKLSEKLNKEKINGVDHVVPIDMDKATSKQKAEMKVSKYDSISTLGKLFTGARKERRLNAKKLKKILKNK